MWQDNQKLHSFMAKQTQREQNKKDVDIYSKQVIWKILQKNELHGKIAKDCTRALSSWEKNSTKHKGYLYGQQIIETREDSA